jgi:hypothetical protein
MTKRKKRKTVMLSKKDSRKNVSNKWQWSRREKLKPKKFKSKSQDKHNC